MSSRQGGKQKPLKAPKKERREEDEDDKALKQKLRDEEKAKKEAIAKLKKMQGGQVVIATRARWGMRVACTAALSASGRTFSTFAVNPETSQAPHGPPRGLINRYVSMGLPPWAAWCSRVNRYSLYRMSDVSPRSFLPKPPQEMDVIWMNERVRERVRTSRQVQNVFRQLKYPYVKTGIHFSDLLNHWVQVPMVEAAMFAIEKEGGFDNFILSRSGPELRSTFGERIRRHLLVRRKEIEKNFVLARQAESLADVVHNEVRAATSEAELDVVLDKYGMNKEEFKRAVASALMRQVKESGDREAVPEATLSAASSLPAS